jgi:hypothetical protein
MWDLPGKMHEPPMNGRGLLSPRRTGRADFPHPALLKNLRQRLSQI